MNVHIKKIATYDVVQIQQFMEDVFQETGFLQRIANKKKILLKPNLLGAFEPEKAVTTHPVVLEALIRLLQREGKQILLGDSSGGTVSMQKVWRKSGLLDLAERYAVELVNFGDAGVHSFDYLGNEIPITQTILDVDGCISISKYKTHGMMRFTGAVKNTYGFVPGLKKAELHKLFPETKAFADLITHIYEAVRDHIDLHIMDGIIGMEGEGPSAGVPRNFGVMFISESAAALDYMASTMMGFDWRNIPIVWNALQSDGILPSRIVVDEIWKEFRFEHVRIGRVTLSSGMMNYIPPFMKSFLRTHFDFYPDFNELCRLCKVCVDSCPVQAITYTKGELHPVIDHKKCIKCLCCHELCPYHAVYIHKSQLAEMLIRDQDYR